METIARWMKGKEGNSSDPLDSVVSTGAVQQMPLYKSYGLSFAPLKTNSGETKIDFSEAESRSSNPGRKKYRRAGTVSLSLLGLFLVVL